MSRKSKVTKGDLMEVVVDRSLLAKESWGGRLLPGTGTVLFQDDFSSVLVGNWVGSAQTRDVMSRDPTRAFIGEASLRVKSSDGTDDYAEAFLPAGPIGKYGLDLHFLFENSDKLDIMNISFDYDGGGVKDYTVAQVRFSVTSVAPIGSHFKIAGKWQYRDESGGWTDISNGNQIFRTYETTIGTKKLTLFWYRLKLIADFQSKCYVSLVVANKTFDLSNIKLNTTTTLDTMPSFPILLRVKSTTGNEFSTWFDAIMFTKED